MSSIGRKVHLLRLDIGWSVEECAYRCTIEANTYTDPEVWRAWERCSDEEAKTNGLIDSLEAVANLLAADPEWIRNSSNNTQTADDLVADVIVFPRSRQPTT